MGLKTKIFELKDSEQRPVKIEVSLFLGSFGIKLFSKIFLLVTPILTPILKNLDFKNPSLDQEIDFDEIVKIIIAKIDEESVLTLIKEIVSGTRLGDQDLSIDSAFDLTFAGEYGLLTQTIKHALEANYSNFFVGNAIKKLIAKSQKMGKK